MIKRKAMRKIFITTLCLFVVLTAYTITIINNDTIPVSLEIEDVTGVTNTSIYLLNNKGYLVKKNIFIDTDDKEEAVGKMIRLLNVSNNYNNLVGLIPKDISLLGVTYEDGVVTINFSKNFKDSLDKELIITSIVKSVYALGDVSGVSIKADGDYLDDFPKIIKNDIDINKETSITSRENIVSVVVYYMMDDNDESYYVPVTKYLNDSREKINIIVDQMRSSSSLELTSLVNSNVELISSREENDMMILNFNNFLFDNNDEVLEEVLYCLSYSVFDNYDVDTVMIEVDGKNISKIERNKV